MALIKKGASSKKFIRSMIIIVVIGVAGGIVYLSINREPTVTLNSGPIKKDLPIVKDSGLDLLNNEVFTGLNQHGDLPVDEGSVGRLNPFTTFVK